MKGEVCLLDVIQFSTMFYISAPSFIGLLLPAAGLRVSGMRSGATNSTNQEKRVQMILLMLPKGCMFNFFESGLYYFTIQKY